MILKKSLFRETFLNYFRGLNSKKYTNILKPSVGEWSVFLSGNRGGATRMKRGNHKYLGMQIYFLTIFGYFDQKYYYGIAWYL